MCGFDIIGVRGGENLENAGENHVVQDLEEGRRKALTVLPVVMGQESPMPASQGSCSAKGSERIKS